MKTSFLRKIKLFMILGALLTAPQLFTSCYTPSPLYGTWTDNAGNKMSFMDDLSFVAKITVGNQPINYEGSYSVIDNVIIFGVSNPVSYQVNTEWDIRGAMLYLTWTTAGGTTMNMTLYHSAR